VTKTNGKNEKKGRIERKKMRFVAENQNQNHDYGHEIDHVTKNHPLMIVGGATYLKKEGKSAFLQRRLVLILSSFSWHPYFIFRL